jgi:site-specific DNA recombinase
MMSPRQRIALYVRISRDPDGTSTAPERQLKDCKAFAKLRGWDVVAVHRDDDLSAFRKNVRRPGYEDLLAGMRAGSYDGVLVWKLDRLVRRVVDFGRFWEVADTHGVRLASATQPVDTEDPVGMLLVHILVAFAQMESTMNSQRVRSAERHAAENGHHKARGWRKRSTFGHKVGWDEVEEGEAVIVRELARRLLAGESVTSLQRELNDRAVAAPGGGRWSRRGLVVLMRSARLFGWREYEGELTSQGTWPAIISEADGRALRDLLDRSNGNGNTRRHLLSGILRCGRCGHALKVGRTTQGQGRYVCPPKSEGGCGGLSILQEPVDEDVDEMIVTALSTPSVARVLVARSHSGEADEAEALLDELRDVERKTEELASVWAEGGLSRAAWIAAQKVLDQRREILSTRLGDVRRSGPIDAIAASESATSTYRSFSVEQKRSVIETLLLHIRVLPVDDPTYLERLALTLREEADEYRLEAAELRSQAEHAEPSERKRLRSLAEKRDADARRRERQIKSGASNANRYRVERLEPVWRA